MTENHPYSPCAYNVSSVTLHLTTPFPYWPWTAPKKDPVRRQFPLRNHDKRTADENVLFLRRTESRQENWRETSVQELPCELRYRMSRKKFTWDKRIPEKHQNVGSSFTGLKSKCRLYCFKAYWKRCKLGKGRIFSCYSQSGFVTQHQWLHR